MPFNHLTTSSALQLARFSDIDAFRPTELTHDARSIALDPANFSSAHAHVALPGCRIIVQSSFARILDVVYRAPGGLVVLGLEGEPQARLNGVALGAHCFFAVRGTDHAQLVEATPHLLAILVLSPELPDCGWFEISDRVQVLSSDTDALAQLRGIIREIVHAAAGTPELFMTNEVAPQFQERLLLAMDALFFGAASGHALGAVSRRHAALVRRIDDYLAAHAASPVYSAELARELGVSLRTLGTVVADIRGMSLHRYIRLKKLWATREQLARARGGTTVISCARANGFHHMGEFAALYRATFRQRPSETLRQAREGHA